MSAVDNSTAEPLVIEQAATFLGLSRSRIARERQRAALGLVRAEAPDWCTDRRVTFFTHESVLAARQRLQEQRARLRAARSGELPQHWTHQ